MKIPASGSAKRSSLIFRKFPQCSGVRQTFKWFHDEGIELPVHGLEDPTIGRVHVFAVGVDGSGERPVADLAPIIVFGKSLAVSPRGEILWTKYLRGPHQIWLADLP